MQVDPVGKRDDQNLYGYTGNDAVNGIDPTGTTEVRITVSRQSESNSSTQSTVSATNGSRTVTVFGLEPPSAQNPSRTPASGSTRIAPGEHGAFVRAGATSRHGYDVVQLEGQVLGTDGEMHSAIQIHRGNTAADTEGCLVVGTTSEADRVGNSRNAHDSIMNLIKETQAADALQQEETTIVVEVVDPPPPPPPPPAQTPDSRSK